MKKENSHNVIFIDDDIDMLSFYTNTFSNQLLNLIDINTITANSGDDGIKKIQDASKNNNIIKVAFIDLNMPDGVDGVETAMAIREINPNIEIVLVSAYSDMIIHESLNNIGLQDKLLFFKKPFEVKELKHIVLNLITKYNNEKIKDEFLANVTHELNTPLSAIIGFSQLLLESDENDTVKEYGNYIGMSANVMKSLIDELIMSVDIKRKGLELFTEKVEMNHLSKTCFDMLTPIFINKKGVEYSYSCLSNKKAYCKLDKDKIVQCFNNLISNSYKFTDCGYVRVETRIVKNKYIISICDSGIGIPEEKIKSIFEPFSRIENTHHSLSGLGLGLSLVKKIMNQHNASINVFSKSGTGSCFEMCFDLLE